MILLTTNRPTLRKMELDKLLRKVRGQQKGEAWLCNEVESAIEKYGSDGEVCLNLTLADSHQ